MERSTQQPAGAAGDAAGKRQRDLQQLQARLPNFPAHLLHGLYDAAACDPQATLQLIATMMGPAKPSRAEWDGRDSQGQPVSRLGLYGEGEGHACNYCGQSARGSVSYGASASRLTVRDYKDMIDRGWRRSGSYLYKPNLKRGCCGLYTIRQDTARFQPSKKHRRAGHRFDRFLSGLYEPQALRAGRREEKQAEEKASAPAALLEFERADVELLHAALLDTAQRMAAENQVPRAVLQGLERPGAFTVTKRRDLATHRRGTKRKASAEQESSGRDPAKSTLRRYASNLALVLAARWARAGGPAGPPPLSAAELAHLLAARFGPDRGFAVSAAGAGFVNFEAPLTAQQAELAAKAQAAVAHSSPPTAAAASSARRRPARTYTCETVPARLTEEKFALYKKYQIAVHQDDPAELSPDSFARFLCTDIFFSEDRFYGAFHQEHRIDGKLFAVGVVDVLPGCLSSVYFFYDPDYAFLSPGVFSALKEIEWVQRQMVTRPDFRFYYMGFYIHTCQKMRYKGQYAPSFLLCPERYTWHRIEECKPLLDRRKYVVFSDVLPIVFADGTLESEAQRQQRLNGYKAPVVAAEAEDAKAKARREKNRKKKQKQKAKAKLQAVGSADSDAKKDGEEEDEEDEEMTTATATQPQQQQASTTASSPYEGPAGGYDARLIRSAAYWDEEAAKCLPEVQLVFHGRLTRAQDMERSLLARAKDVILEFGARVGPRVLRRVALDV